MKGELSMYEGNQADIRMLKMLLSGEETEPDIYKGEIITCQEEMLSMLLLNAELVELSLDAIYECNIVSEEEQLTCRGRVRERYENRQGKVCVFEITNGFFKVPDPFT